MYHYPSGYGHNYSSPYPSSQGYPSYPYSAQARGYPVSTHPAPFASQSVQQSSPSSQASSSSPKPLKRPRTEKMSKIPDLPQPIFKVAIAHRSLEPRWDDDFGDSQRLATIGRMILPAVITEVLAMKTPLIDDLKEEVDKRLTNETIAEWCHQCDLHKDIMCVPAVRESLNDADESCEILYTFVGAVHTANGVPGVRAWLGKLIDPEYEEDDESALKRAKLEPTTNGHSASQPPPPPAYQPPPPSTAPPPMPPGPAIGQGSTALPRLNQTAAQRRVTVEWKTSSTGPAHNMQWTAECLLNGISKAQGTAQSKQAAKEQAARLVCQMMSW